MTFADYILRMTPVQDRDRMQLKSDVARVFGDRVVDNRARYLFSPDPALGHGSSFLRVRTLDGSPPRPGKSDLLRRVEIPFPSLGENIQAMVWISVRNRPNANGRDLDADVKRAAMAVSSILQDARIDVMSRCYVGGTKGGKDVGFILRAGLVYARGRLSDADKARHLATCGVGRNKAFGFGLLDLHAIGD